MGTSSKGRLKLYQCSCLGKKDKEGRQTKVIEIRMTRLGYKGRTGK